MRTVGLLLRQVRYENRAFWRNPAAAFFTVVFPLMFLVIFNLLFGNNEIRTDEGSYTTSTFYVPAIVAFSIVGACFTNVAMGVTATRDQGLLKRTRATPLPTWTYLLGKALHAVLIALLLTVVVSGMGALVYGVNIPTTTLPAFAIAVIVGAMAFSTLGLAVTAIIPNVDAAPAVVNGIVLPLLFISDVFIPMEDAPAWIGTVADIFPVRHLSTALHTAFNPFETGSGFEWTHLLVVMVWAAMGLALSARFFRWEPRR